MPGSTSPKVWVPSTKPLSLATVSAGEWVQVQLSYRRTNTTGIVSTPGRFMVHVIFEPNSDDSVNHQDQPTVFGGSPTAGVIARSQYHIDPGVCFQVPWNGQLSLVAGGDSADTCILDVVLRRGFPPRMPARSNVDLYDLPDIEALSCSNPLAAYMMLMDAMARLCDVGGTIRPMGERIWWPPVIGKPSLVPATWVAIPGPREVPPVPSIPFPSGAQEIELVDASETPSSPIKLIVGTLGNAVDVNVASGLNRTIAQFTQGGACPDGVPALWAPYEALNSATVWSTLGN